MNLLNSEILSILVDNKKAIAKKKPFMADMRTPHFLVLIAGLLLRGTPGRFIC
jgi:hypothetical protein